MTDSGGGTTGIWFGEDDDLLDDFDDAFGTGQAQYSRSDEIRQAMRLRLAVADVLNQHGLTFETEQEQRMWVRQALLDRIRREGTPTRE